MRLEVVVIVEKALELAVSAKGLSCAGQFDH